MNRRLTTRRSAALIALATAATTIGAGALSTTAVGASSTAGNSTTVAACAVTWGSGLKTAGTFAGGGQLTNVRAGQQDCYDRLVLDGATWAQVRYVDQVRSDGSGAVVPLRGGAKLEIITSRADDPNTGNPTYHPANPSELVSVTGWQTFRQAAFAGSFEGQSTVGLGVRALLPFRAFTLTGPPRVVIDVAHHW